MEKHIEVMKKSIELSETIIEGLQHIQKQLREDKHEQTVFLFEDVLVAYSTVSRSVDTVLKELSNEAIPAMQVDLSKAADLVVTTYEEKNYAKV
ncbi:hypothetical protein ACJ2A9_13690 [Anaerobacillus sp. MEB173]|uniref:hypothetical protein n=1 Tax=Anaerobacillus sp. MEB173 TaxID=3383345 RepID=UPI003F91439C